MTEPETPPEPQGRVFGIPFDFRPPTLTRAKARWWNPSDPHLLTPRVFGVGWDLNSYWLTHPRAFLAGRKK
jgi:hypothetical protein